MVRDEFAGEGAGKERGLERGHLPLRRSQPRFNPLGQRKQDAITVFGL